MNKRGRKSSAEIELAGQVTKFERPTVPHDLTDEECEIWVGIVNEMPADYFTAATIPLLVQYARHVVQSRKVRALIEKAESNKKTEAREYDRLLKIQARESMVLASLATKMRITHQSTYDRQKILPKSTTQLLSDF